MRTFLKYWLPVVGWCGLIFWLSSLQHLDTGWGIYDFILRKCAHMTEYGVLYLLARRAFAGTTALQPTMDSFIFTVLYAASDEFHQSFVPTRGPSVRDVMLDSAGAYIALRLRQWIHGRPSKGRVVKILVSVLGICMVLVMGGCGGPDKLFNKAQKLETKGFFVEAGITYDKLAKKYPLAARAPEALYRTGRIYQKKLKLFSYSNRYYLSILDKYSSSQPWASLAGAGLLTSPNYFPLHAGNFWIEGDSDTGGVNMRAQWTCDAVSSGTYAITRRIYAGSHLVKELKQYYRVKGSQLCQYARQYDDTCVIMLAYPFAAGRSWRTVAEGSWMEYKVASDGERVTVKAGSFPGCLKIGERNLAYPGSVKYNYYAPEVGWVLTTTALVGGIEHRSTELLSYKIFPEDF